MTSKSMREPRRTNRPLVEELVQPRPLPPPSPPAHLPPPPPSQDEVRLRAYEIYLARRPNPGSPMDDWLRAERELLGKYAAAKEAAGCRCSGGKCSRKAEKPAV